MKPKRINTLYWVFTILFSILMLSSAWDSLLVTENSVKIIHDMLGYPRYFIPFTGWAKLIGVIAILVPSFNRIKEWAYAGLFFDLAAVVYSGIAANKTFDPMMLTLLAWIIPGILSYVYWHKKMKLVSGKKAAVASKKEPALSLS